MSVIQRTRQSQKKTFRHCVFCAAIHPEHAMSFAMQPVYDDLVRMGNPEADERSIDKCIRCRKFRPGERWHHIRNQLRGSL